jgi:hypothetical protein
VAMAAMGNQIIMRVHHPQIIPGEVEGAITAIASNSIMSWVDCIPSATATMGNWIILWVYSQIILWVEVGANMATKGQQIILQVDSIPGATATTGYLITMWAHS